MTEQNTRRKIWGRRLARPLKDKQKDLLSMLLPTIQVTLDPNSAHKDTGFFDVPMDELWLEIGYGGGEHLAAQAQQNPHVGMLGCEPFINGVASLLTHIEEANLKNIRIVVDDARLLLASLPDACLHRVFILFPDPWPKKRHHKRRIVSDETVAALSRVLVPGGRVHLATDIADYAVWMQDTFSRFPNFSLHLEGRENIHERPESWPQTRYEAKGMEAGRDAAYMVYIRA